ncbi:hypothetical protein PIB30_082186 [Stylosanthes scabra]|uniref:Putative plant transposon protein domain-containing protein n=1 Tax=Stylosanthes scabra TaxID=79078 RepID=A0ABU6TSK1_9FABA|nr:hypothetical protein [Stylosanthes scabra]
MARPRNGPCTFKPNLLTFSLILTAISLFFSNSLNSKTHIFTHHYSYIAFMSRRRQAAIDEATSSRGRVSRNSNRGRQDTFPNERFDHQLPFDRWKGMENWDIVHEWIIRLDGEEEAIFRNRIQGLGWGLMYEDLRIPFTEADVRRYLNIPGETPDDDQDDNFEALVKAHGRGDDMNMAEIYSVIGREGTNWANDPVNNTIPKSINNGILNPRATAWHKIINANIDPKTHGTNFDMKHALLIYVLMAGGEVNLPRIMREILVSRLTKHSRHLLPYPVFISRIATRNELPEFPNDKFYTVQPVDTYVPYGDLRGERARAPVRQRRQPPPQDELAEQLPQLETSATPSAPTQPATDHSYQQIMRHLERQERLLRRQGCQIANTQLMIRQAFLDTVFEGLVSDDSSESQEF